MLYAKGVTVPLVLVAAFEARTICESLITTEYTTDVTRGNGISRSEKYTPRVADTHMPSAELLGPFAVIKPGAIEAIVFLWKNAWPCFYAGVIDQ